MACRLIVGRVVVRQACPEVEVRTGGLEERVKLSLAVGLTNQRPEVLARAVVARVRTSADTRQRAGCRLQLDRITSGALHERTNGRGVRDENARSLRGEVLVASRANRVGKD